MTPSHQADSSTTSSTPRSGATAGNGGNGHHPRPPTMTSSHHGDSSSSSTPRSSASAGNGLHPRPPAMAPSHHTDSSSNSTPRSGASAGNGGNGHHLPPLPPAPAPVAAAPPAQPQPNVGPQVRFMTSFGGCILPRPGDRRLRYVGGETRIVAFPRAAASYATLLTALARVAPHLFVPGAQRPTLKYKLPQDDLDSLISVSSDDDVDHLMDEIDRLQDLNANVAVPTRLRAFLFAPQPPGGAFGSILSGTGGEATCDQWFVDALNAPAPHPIERGRCDSSSIISDVPDYLFGLDNACDERSPSTIATRNKPDTETPRGDDNAPAPAPGEFASPYAPLVGSSWPVPPPPYMGQPVYYFPVAPVHYPSAQGGGYIPGPVYHMVGGGGTEAPVHPHAAPGGTGGVYGVPVPHPMQPFPPMIYAPPRPVVYAPEGKPPAEGGVQSSPESSP